VHYGTSTLPPASLPAQIVRGWDDEAGRVSNTRHQDRLSHPARHQCRLRHALSAKTYSDREITFHGLRHTHASQLINASVDIVTISKRLGHAKPSVTLAIYAHMFTSDDSKAAAAINAALSVS